MKLSLATWNLYSGIDWEGLLAAAPADIADHLLRGAERTDFRARAPAIAADIGAHRPDFIALQELSLYGLTEHPERSIDFLPLLLNALAASRCPYEALGLWHGFQGELPFAGSGGALSYQDRQTILRRLDSPFTAVDMRPLTYQSTHTAKIGGFPLPVPRGALIGTFSSPEKRFVLAATHLEFVSDDEAAAVQHRQGEELRAALDALDALDKPDACFAVGDFNSAPTPGPAAAHETFLAAGFSDGVAGAADADTGPTSSRSAALDSPDDELSERIDHIFSRGPARAVQSRRLGIDPGSRRPLSSGASLWPSDHAGLVVRFEL